MYNENQNEEESSMKYLCGHSDFYSRYCLSMFIIVKAK